MLEETAFVLFNTTSTCEPAAVWMIEPGLIISPTLIGWGVGSPVRKYRAEPLRLTTLAEPWSAVCAVRSEVIANAMPHATAPLVNCRISFIGIPLLNDSQLFVRI